MDDYEITLDFGDDCEEIVVPEGTTLAQLADEYQDHFPDEIILAMVNGKLRELGKKIACPGTIRFVTVADRDGRRTYRRSVTLVLQKAIQKLYGSEAYLKVLHSIGEGYYCEIQVTEAAVNTLSEMMVSSESCFNSARAATSTAERESAFVPAGGSDAGNCKNQMIPGTNKIKITAQDIERIRACMGELVEQNLPIKKHSVKTEEAERLFREKGMHDKERLFHYRRCSRVNLYNLDGVEDYFYGYMADATGRLKYYDFECYEDGFVILFPGSDSHKVDPLQTSNKLFHTLHESREWSRMLDVGTIGALNDAIAAGRGQDLILLSEALMEERIGSLAAQIAERKNTKFVMIAGPSSSGKTSFANRLSIQLIAKGLKPHPLSLDDYYVDREFCPRNPDGSYDFECLESLDIKLFNEDMVRLLNGEEVELPAFNFKTGKREYRGHKMKLGNDDILVIEGIHGLNDRLSHMLPAESKFKIYISALTQLNIDEHNPHPTTDSRLIRRIVRDARTRGTDAQSTIAMWPSVRRGEEKYIFPFQESADVMFNSALVYELAVLKVYAEPLLFQIPRDCPEYLEAKRLLKFLDYFLPLPTEGISKNSLIREFVGGSCFHV
jgi:uridine kinase